MTMREPAHIPLKDRDTEKAFDEVRRGVVDVMRDPFLNGRDLEVTLVDGIELPIRHGLGRKFKSYSMSAPMGAVTSGRIVEAPPDADRETIYLTATGYGATITVRLHVW